MILNDLRCTVCGRRRRDVLFNAAAPPLHCGAPMAQDWSHGHPPATDLHAPRVFQGLDKTFSSTRQAERGAKNVAKQWTEEMQRAGKDFSWSVDGVSGDKRGGAREVTRARGVAASYRGQRSRVSTGERRR